MKSQTLFFFLYSAIMYLIYQAAFKMFLSVIFISLFTVCLDVDLFVFIFLGIIKLLNCEFACIIPSLFHIWDSNDMYVRPLNIVSYLTEVLLMIPPLSFRLDSGYCLPFMFTELLFRNVLNAVMPLQGGSFVCSFVFILGTVFFRFRISVWLF